MQYDNEAIHKYRAANRMAVRAQKKARKLNSSFSPAPISFVFTKDMISYTLDLGVRDIPVNQIVGVVSVNEKSREYAEAFLPLASDNSNLAHSWCELYTAYSMGTQKMDPIRCYEYLGKFYVQDGLKRVSVLKYLDIDTVPAQVIRYMPKRTSDKEVLDYYEFLTYYRQTKLYQLHFSQPKTFYKLQFRLGYEPGHVWNENDRCVFLIAWERFRRAYRAAFSTPAQFREADYFAAVLEDCSITQIQDMADRELTYAIISAQRNIDAEGFVNHVELPGYSAEYSKILNRIKQFCAYMNIIPLFNYFGKNAITRVRKEITPFSNLFTIQTINNL